MEANTDRFMLSAGSSPARPSSRPTSRPSSSRALSRLSSRQSAPSRRLLDSVPEGLVSCEDGCFWRWIVQTLLGEIVSLQRSLDAATVDLQDRAETRRTLEQVREHQDTMEDESRRLRETLATLTVEVPRLRLQCSHLTQEGARLAQKKLDLQDEKLQLRIEITNQQVRLDPMQHQAEVDERQAADERCQQEDMRHQIAAASVKLSKMDMDIEWFCAERDRLRGEVERLEGARGQRRIAKRPKPR
eukprot:TRINITY_DN61523_c0_g1_i1.p1 TRINITY_DN61523_c0_g1~~TRINITY_DN61523_c0_g1_i1.p1  ORF type:complete len:245 (+),score=52.53 TRINITY_DN61523_c0_g1_i1:61-795(+)